MPKRYSGMANFAPLQPLWKYVHKTLKKRKSYTVQYEEYNPISIEKGGSICIYVSVFISIYLRHENGLEGGRTHQDL